MSLIVGWPSYTVSNFGGWVFRQLRAIQTVSPRNLIRHWKIVRGDKVAVISGKERGKTGIVLGAQFNRNTVKVYGLNLRRIKFKNGYKVVERGIHYSNVMLIDPKTERKTRISLVSPHGNDNSSKSDSPPVRVSQLSGHVIPWKHPRKHKEKFFGVESSADDSTLATSSKKKTLVEGRSKKVKQRVEKNQELERILRQERESSDDADVAKRKQKTKNKTGKMTHPKDTPKEAAMRQTYNYEKDVEAMNLIRQTMKKYNEEFK